MATTKSFKPEPVANTNSLNFLHGATHAVTALVQGNNLSPTAMFTLPQGAIIRGWVVNSAAAYTKPGSIGIGIAGTAEYFAAVPVPYVGTFTIDGTRLNSALADELAVLGTFFVAHGTTPGTVAVTCLFSLAG